MGTCILCSWQKLSSNCPIQQFKPEQPIIKLVQTANCHVTSFSVHRHDCLFWKWPLWFMCLLYSIRHWRSVDVELNRSFSKEPHKSQRSFRWHRSGKLGVFVFTRNVTACSYDVTDANIEFCFVEFSFWMTVKARFCEMEKRETDRKQPQMFDNQDHIGPTLRLNIIETWHVFTSMLFRCCVA